MTDRERVCQRAGCAQLASVTLSFRYDARQASLMDLSAQKHPADYDLCGAHADLMSVPRGWERLDRRSPAPDPQLEPEGLLAGDAGSPHASAPKATWAVRSRAKRDDEAPHPDARSFLSAEGVRQGQELSASEASQGSSGAGRRSGRAFDEGARRPSPFNRYAALTAELPRLAAALAAPDEGRDGPAAHSYEVVTDTMVAEGSWAEGSAASFAERDDVIEGQLQMPIEPEPEGVVVALTRTRQV